MDEAFVWDPDQYGLFAAPRLRPAVELRQRIEHPAPRRVHDLGTGRGEMARAMAHRWPDADVIGSDLSEEMLAEAAATASRVRWEQVDVHTWHPGEPHDVIYANAVLHWIDDHAELFPRLVGALRPGGILAVQMPMSWSEPSHHLMREILATGGVDGAPLGPPSFATATHGARYRTRRGTTTSCLRSFTGSTSGRPATSRLSRARMPCSSG